MQCWVTVQWGNGEKLVVSTGPRPDGQETQAAITAWGLAVMMRYLEQARPLAFPPGLVLEDVMALYRSPAVRQKLAAAINSRPRAADTED